MLKQPSKETLCIIVDMKHKAVRMLLMSLIVEAMLAMILLVGSASLCNLIDRDYTPKKALTSVGLTLEVKVAKATGHYL